MLYPIIINNFTATLFDFLEPMKAGKCIPLFAQESDFRPCKGDKGYLQTENERVF